MSDMEAIMREALDGHRYVFGADDGSVLNVGAGDVVRDVGIKARTVPVKAPVAPAVRDWIHVATPKRKQKRNPGLPRCADVFDAVAHVTQIKTSEIRGVRRAASIVRARLIAYAVAHEFTGYSLTRIGKELGGKSHSTVKNGVNVVAFYPDRFQPDLGKIRAKFLSVDNGHSQIRCSVHGANQDNIPG